MNLAMANEQTTEKLEARIEELEEALWRITQWGEAYPTDIFPEPDKAYYAKARDVLEANGMTLDRLSGAAMRHVAVGMSKIARAALKDAAP